MKRHGAIDRRGALRLLSAAGLAPLLGTSGIGMLGGCSEPSRPGDVFAPLFSEPDDMARIGRLWLAAQATSPSIDDLLAELPVSKGQSLEVLRKKLAERQREDWLAGRVERVRGFRLARTETLLYALSELLVEQA